MAAPTASTANPAEGQPALAETSIEPITFDSVSPANGQLVGTFDIHTAADVQAAVARARAAATWWAELGEPGRRARLSAWRRLLLNRIDELAALMALENGKSVDDAVVEVTIAISHLAWATSHARKLLGRRRVSPGLLAINHSATLEYLPFGVVGVIGPWNYPVHTPLGSISYALAAGNSVVFKPSEFTPAVGKWLVDSFAEVVPEQPVLQLITGFGATGAALCESGVDKLAFTGSAATGRRVMAACATTLTPCVVECGGKDALIVAADADLELAADQTVWGSMFNAGQTCAGVERVYVAAEVYDRFAARVVELAAAVRTGESGRPHYGPITMPSQLTVIARHVEDALSRGGKALLGGQDSIRPPYVEPIVLADVPADSVAMTDETFGPVVVLTKVADTDEAVRLANSGTFGLGASVFSKRHGQAIARRLDAGMVSINSVLTYASVPGLPWGGTGESGFGRIHGPDGLREFARSRAITSERFPSPLKIASFSKPDKAIGQLRQLAKLRWSRR